MKDDVISRQAAIDVIRNWKIYETTEGLADRINKLPSAQQETCEDAVSRNAIIQKLNTMDRYVSEELILCDTDKKFPKNEVFIVDDVYEEIVENLPSAQPDLSGYSDRLWKAAYERGKAEAQLDIIRCKDCKHRGEKPIVDGRYWCEINNSFMYYCSDAERRADE